MFVAQLTPEDLLPGETVLLSKMASLIISVKEHGLSRFAFADYSRLLGMNGGEPISGTVFLTNYRILFRTRRFNRLNGTHSVWLPTVTDARGHLQKLVVETLARKIEYVMYFRSEIIAEILELSRKFGPAEREQLRRAITARPEAVGSSLTRCEFMDNVNRVIGGVRKISSITQLLTSDTATDLVFELLDSCDIGFGAEAEPSSPPQEFAIDEPEFTIDDDPPMRSVPNSSSPSSFRRSPGVTDTIPMQPAKPRRRGPAAPVRKREDSEEIVRLDDPRVLAPVESVPSGMESAPIRFELDDLEFLDEPQPVSEKDFLGDSESAPASIPQNQSEESISNTLSEDDPLDVFVLLNSEEESGSDPISLTKAEQR